MLSLFQSLFATDFMPHIYCLRDPGLIRLDVFSDVVIALSYALIPLALVLLMRRRRDLVFPWMFTLFGVFILGCGLTHVMSIITLWNPVYRFEGLVKAITALASFPTAILLFRLLPQIEALPSPAQMRSEIEQRLSAEAGLRHLNEELERRVAQRTADLEYAHAQLVESEERFRTLAQAVPILLWTTDPNGQVTYVSLRYEQYTGLPAGHLLGDRWTEALHPDDRAPFAAVWSAALAESRACEVEYRLRRYDGIYRWFVARAIPMRGDYGPARQWLGSSTDIHELKKTETALRRSNEELRQFAYAAAHDLQEPLRNVSNSLGLLNRRYRHDFDHTALKWLDWSLEGAQRMHQMVHDLLSYSRAVEDADPVAPAVSSEAAARLALLNLAAGVEASHAAVHLAPLPLVEAHQAHLVQLFQNLIGNALKYRQPGLPPVIHLAAERSGADWKFSVSDNGIGFDSAYAEKIFGVFKRLHLREQYPGNGIGLAICARIVAHYGGRIWAESHPGCGATFFFTFAALPGIAEVA